MDNKLLARLHELIKEARKRAEDHDDAKDRLNDVLIEIEQELQLLLGDLSGIPVQPTPWQKQRGQYS